ncbi:hypothetical protein R3P38DRAFT_2772041 [Favolaschia claudopus]|uniref:BZIP domain-containing protein n=1 Tax=Favolaschia claudopus TaxID=2862362 RepID=A0AAW0C860_9AGAR
MPSTGHHLRPLLPRTPSMTRPEPFLLKTTRNLESDTNVNRNSAQRRSAGQRKRREREAKENSTKATRRSVAQRARRQRELAAKIEDLLDIKEHDSQQSRAQKLRRKVEQGERRLRAFPDCDHSRALDEALDREWMPNQPRREDLKRSSQEVQCELSLGWQTGENNII